MKRLLAISLALILMLTLASCAGTSSTPTGNSESSATKAASESLNSDETTTSAESSTAEVLDLTGGWKQKDAKTDSLYHVAMIDNEMIEIYWKSDDGTLSLYWAGTYVAPTTETNEYSWDSINDKSQTDSALLASGADTKTITYKDGVISYEATMQDVTSTITLERSEEINIKVQ
jgi:hypothetical protein